MKKCPCHSGKEYPNCCEPYHQGKLPENAVTLMRSRYAAYALGLADYIISTTHPSNNQAIKDLTLWKKQILDFSSNTQFIGLEILEDQETPTFAIVTFKAQLTRNGQDATFTETSRFEIQDGKWLYHSCYISI